MDSLDGMELELENYLPTFGAWIIAQNRVVSPSINPKNLCRGALEHFAQDEHRGRVYTFTTLE